MKFRRVVSLTSALTFFAILLTSIILYIAPQGRIANWNNWQLFWISKREWIDIHIYIGILLMIMESEVLGTEGNVFSPKGHKKARMRENVFINNISFTRNEIRAGSKYWRKR